MIRHLFVGTARAGVTAEQLDELIRRWRALPAQIEEIQSMTAGRNISPRDQTFTVALVADFANMETWERYMDHPAHLAISQQLTPLLIQHDSRAAVEFFVEDK